MPASNPLSVIAGRLTQGSAIFRGGNPVNVQVTNSGAFLLKSFTTVTQSSGNYAVGIAGFFTTTGLVVPGAWTYWAGTTAITLDASLWTGTWTGGTRSTYAKSASGSVAIGASSPGWYYVPFGTAYSVTTGGLGWVTTQYESSGSEYTAGTNVLFQPVSTVPMQAGPYTWYETFHAYASGNTVPDNNASTETYLCEPVVVVATTTTTAAYTQPSVGATVVVAVSSASGMLVGQTFVVAGGGFYKIVSISGLNVTALNVSDATNGVAVGVSVASGSYVY